MNSHARAMFVALDLDLQFEVQYNPTSLQLNEAPSWAEHASQGGQPALEYQQTPPATLEMDLVFDTTRDASDVRQTWINRLRHLMAPVALARSGEASELGKRRPTVVLFTWGTLSFEGVIETLQASMILFSASGIPLRAKVHLKLKQWTRSVPLDVGRCPPGYSAARIQVVELEAGQSLSALAALFGTTTRVIAELNNLNDPLGVEPGTALLVPV